MDSGGGVAHSSCHLVALPRLQPSALLSVSSTYARETSSVRLLVLQALITIYFIHIINHLYDLRAVNAAEESTAAADGSKCRS